MSKTFGLPPKVSQFYNRDWQFAAKLIQAPMLRTAAVTISLAPFVLGMFGVLQLTPLGLSIPQAFWFIWLSAVSYGVGWLIFTLSCPDIIKRYKNYKEYKEEEHSHRWVIWLFYYSVQQAPKWEAIINECVAKKVATEEDDADLAKVGGFIPGPAGVVELLRPVNVDRDLYIPVRNDGKRVVISLQETDPSLGNKEKELFWILFTHLTKSNPLRRWLVWTAIYTSFALTALPIAINIWKVASYLLGCQA